MTFGIWGQGLRWSSGHSSIFLLSAPSDIHVVSKYSYSCSFLVSCKKYSTHVRHSCFFRPVSGAKVASSWFCWTLWQRSGIYFFLFSDFLWSPVIVPVISLWGTCTISIFVACVTHLCCLLWHDFCVTWLKISVCKRSKWTAAAQGVEWFLQWYEGRWFKSTCCT